MKIATVVTSGPDPALVRDTVESVLHYVGDCIVVVDGTLWDLYKNESFPVPVFRGYDYGTNVSPHVNMALGMQLISDMHEDADWYCHCDHDSLFGSEYFKEVLEKSEPTDWVFTADAHEDNMASMFLSLIMGEPITVSHYGLGCCYFFRKSFVSKLRDIDFFRRFVGITSGMSALPLMFYSGWDASEHIYPTLCRHFGGSVRSLSSWCTTKGWLGDYEHFPLRWKPELEGSWEGASIMHPLKDYDGPARTFHREGRKNNGN